MPRLTSTQDLEALRMKISSRRDLEKPQKPFVAICAGTGCLGLGARKVVNAFEEELKKRGLEKEIEIKKTGCPGFCEKGTLVVIYPEGIYYLKVKPEDVPEIVEETLLGGRLVDRLLYKDPATGNRAIHEDEIPFYKYQTRFLIKII
jgi:NADH-quinone oxidoreductase subunit F